VLVAHLHLELFQLDVKTAFLNGNLEEEIYMYQPIGFVSKGQEDKFVIFRSLYMALNSLQRRGTLDSMKPSLRLA